METKSIKISTVTYEILKRAAKGENTSMQGILDKLLKEYQTKKFFKEVNEAYAGMSSSDWEEEMEERKQFDNTLADGLEDEDETW